LIQDLAEFEGEASEERFQGVEGEGREEQDRPLCEQALEAVATAILGANFIQNLFKNDLISPLKSIKVE
jgi:hypothetical protein